MVSGARTIEIFLPDGEPTGVKVAHIRNRNIEATYIPRAKLSDLKSRESLQGVGIYLLVGSSEEHAKPLVYIGEAEVVYTRLLNHNANKDFWNYAISLTSNSKHLTKTHVKFLEWLCHNKATNANRCLLENGNIPTKPYAPESTEADLFDNFDSIDLLVSTLGLNIFQPLTSTRQPALTISGNTNTIQSSDDMLFRIKGRGAEASGKYTQEGFLVFAGAKLSKDLSESLSKTNVVNIREKLIKDNVVNDKNGTLFFVENYLFPSPSAAASLIVGNSLNGWITWKLSDGRTLNDIYRKAVL
ncbi:MAG: GIY-YIG nuclease family protein [Pseudomonadota bacterium]